MELVIVLTEVLFFIGCSIHCYTDFQEMLLYDGISLMLLLAGIGHNLCLQEPSFIIGGALATGGVFWALYYISPQGIGFGDVKLAVVLGAWLGWQQGLMSLLIALWIGFIIGLGLLLLKVKGSKDAIPFGPYMCISGVISLYYGKEIMAFYCSLF